MQVFNELDNKLICIGDSVKVITEVVDEIIVYGYISYDDLRFNSDKLRLVLIKSGGNLIKKYAILDNVKNRMFFSKRLGYYVLDVGLSAATIREETEVLGSGGFPYSFDRLYEAVDNFNLFEGKSTVIDKEFKHPLSKFMDYTFGIEFETSRGYIPEDICFRDGLIPLRDGSITGLEYSTLILKGNSGLSMMKQQIETLKNYTEFDKNCSLHIHFGGFPLDPEKIWALYSVCARVQNDIEKYTPKYTFHSSEYKATRKDYCKKLPTAELHSFEELYRLFVERNFLGDLTQPHPRDIGREAKWRIPTRYYWVNFINIMCYNINKTIEFRLLRPSYNYTKITLWMYIFTAIMKYADKNSKSCHLGKNRNHLNLVTILRAVYPDGLSKKLISKLEDLKKIKEEQETVYSDYIGEKIKIDDKYIPEFEII